MSAEAPQGLKDSLRDILSACSVSAISLSTDVFDCAVGAAIWPDHGVAVDTWFQQASLSKTVATAFALELFAARGISFDAPVAELLQRKLPGAPDFRLAAAPGVPPEWVDKLTLRMLMDHTGLGGHYVAALDSSQPMPPTHRLLNGCGAYAGVRVEKEPGVAFGYSGGGFLLLQHVVERLIGEDVEAATRPWLDAVGMRHFSFAQRPHPDGACAHGHREDLAEHCPGVGRFWFPAFAAGGVGTPRSLMQLLGRLVSAYHNPAASWPLSHATARTMLTANPLDAVQEGCRAFMGCKVGVGTFIAECGPNLVALHQAANEGFRGVYAVVFDGPDRGRGAVILSNGDNSAVVANARALQELLLADGGWWAGVSASYLREHCEFDGSGLSQETVVNQGYKELVFGSFSSRRDFLGALGAKL